MTGLDRTSQPKRRGTSVTNLRLAALDQRVEAILADPDSYFATAVERAWTIARAEVEADLARRGQARQNHRKPRLRPDLPVDPAENAQPGTARD